MTEVIRSEMTVNNQTPISRLLTDHFRCPDDLIDFSVSKQQSGDVGYFRFGPNAICYGECASGTTVRAANGRLHDALPDVRIDGRSVQLPFDPVHVVNNLLHERYRSNGAFGPSANNSNSLIRKLYYLSRPFLTVALRKHLQRIYLGGWQRIQFPHWPVDYTVESIQEQLLTLSMNARNIDKIPFIWFWPKGALSCTTVTHDVETTAGWDFCSQLMDLDDSFGIKSAFQIVPEERYIVEKARLDSIKERGFELNVHDLNHDGNLMMDRDEFLRRVCGINHHARDFGALGFRTAVLYRNLDWFDALDFDYDISVPNVAHLDPQRGGCCTVFPFFNGKMIELPVTMAQDYSLFHILNDYSIDLWQKQISLIREKHGLMQMIVHPDYILGEAERRVYIDLLRYLSELRDCGETWMALPAEVAAWWRLRSKLRLTSEGGNWRIEGDGRENARLAYATLVNGKLEYKIDPNV
jgi:hypothetical protein